MIRMAFLLAAVLVLGGCISGPRQDAKCRSYGAVPGTDAYINCRAQLEAARKIAAAQ